MNKLRLSFAMSAFALMSAMTLNAQASTVEYQGAVTATTGAFVGILPPPLPEMSGFITFDDAAVAGGLAGPGDILAAQVNIGTTVCVALDVGGCAPGSIATPITSIDAAAATFDANGNPTGGSLTVTGNLTSPIVLTLPVVFDLTAGTWSADGGVFGTVSGTWVRVPPRVLGPFDPNKVPTLPIYALILTGVGLLLVAGRRLREIQSRN